MKNSVYVAILALALARNPGIRTQTRQAELAGLNLRSTRFGRRPDFAIGPSVEYLDNEQTYGLTATLALPLWDQKQGAIQTATEQAGKLTKQLLGFTRMQMLQSKVVDLNAVISQMHPIVPGMHEPVSCAQPEAPPIATPATPPSASTIASLTYTSGTAPP